MDAEEKNVNLDEEEEVVRIPLIYELSKPGRKAYEIPELDVPYQDPAAVLGEKYIRKEKANLPE